MPNQIQKIIEEFEYTDLDAVHTPSGWREARLQNRFNEGYEIWYDPKRMSWRGKKKQLISELKK